MNIHSSMSETMPHSVEAEQMVLGCLMVNNGVFQKIGASLTPDHFFDPVHGYIYQRISQRISKGHLVTPVAMKADIGDHQGLKELGGPAYLARLAGAAISPGHIADYAAIIMEKAVARLVLASVGEARDGIIGGEVVTEAVARLHGALMALPEAGAQSASVSILKATTMMLERQVAAYRGELKLTKTGFDPLDRIIKGLEPGDLMLIGGTTSMGKTATACEMAHRMASNGMGAAYASLEMGEAQLASRITSTRSRINYSTMRDPSEVDEATFRKWVDASEEVSALPLYVIPRHIRDIPAINAAAQRARHDLGENCPLTALFVDYAQLIRGDGRGRYEQMTSVATGLKTLAALLNIPVIALVQLDRKLGEREDKRPHLFDIKETGQFENDADFVVMCHREEYYLSRQGPKVGRDGKVAFDDRVDWEAELAAVKGKIELIVRKNRHGQLGVAEMGFHDATNRFWNLGDDQKQHRMEEF